MRGRRVPECTGIQLNYKPMEIILSHGAIVGCGSIVVANCAVRDPVKPEVDRNFIITWLIVGCGSIVVAICAVMTTKIRNKDKATKYRIGVQINREIKKSQRGHSSK